MGKKGEKLRLMKKEKWDAFAESQKFVFTKKELGERDRQLLRSYRETVKKEVDRRIKEEWDERARLFRTDDMEENFHNFLQCAFALSARVLHDRFGWAPVCRKDARLVKFAEAWTDEVEKICGSQGTDIRQYARDVEKDLGIAVLNGGDADVPAD